MLVSHRGLLNTVSYFFFAPLYLEIVCKSLRLFFTHPLHHRGHTVASLVVSRSFLHINFGFWIALGSIASGYDSITEKLLGATGSIGPGQNHHIDQQEPAVLVPTNRGRRSLRSLLSSRTRTSFHPVSPRKVTAFWRASPPHFALQWCPARPSSCLPRRRQLQRRSRAFRPYRPPRPALELDKTQRRANSTSRGELPAFLAAPFRGREGSRSRTIAPMTGVGPSEGVKD